MSKNYISSRTDAPPVFGMKDQVGVLDSIREAVVVVTMDCAIVYWNKAAETLYGWTKEEAIVRADHGFLYAAPEDLAAICEALRDRLEWEGEIQQLTKDGRTVLVAKRASILSDDLGQPKYIFSINRDITERKRRETLALRVQRLESIGTLAGGVAHDLNNMLTPILLSIDLLKGLVIGPDGLKILESVETSAQRGSDLVKQLLTFSRGKEGALIELHAVPFLKQVVKMARETFPKNVEIAFIENPALWKIRADPVQLEQVSLNLCVNARDAMPDGGRLTISTENVLKNNQRFVEIRFADTGTGIATEHLERIFDPFFTTKPVGKGTGLGLSTVSTIIQAHGGSITVESQIGKGSEFLIMLPALAESRLRKTLQPPPPELHGRGETILVVDDEPGIREVARRTLEAFGYKTFAACDGAEAVEIYRAHKDQIALVFTDIMMPILDGIGASDAMVALNPEVRIIAASGLSSREDLPEPLASRLCDFLNKPYSTIDMLRTIRAALDAPVAQTSSNATGQ